MRNRLMATALAVVALAACEGENAPAQMADVGIANIEAALAELPPRNDNWSHFRMEHLEGAEGPGYAEEGTVNFYVGNHLVYSTTDGCHIGSEGYRECGWDVPKAVTAGEVSAFALPEAHSFGIVRDGQVQMEIPVPFEVAWLRYDGELIWVMPLDYIRGSEPPLLYSTDGELVRTPHYWEAR